jgi:hypothetical protein
MMGSVFNIFGLVFILFMVIMFIGVIFRSGFSGLFKAFLKKIFAILLVIAVLLTIGVIIYAFVTSTDPVVILKETYEFLKTEILNI